jgi:hypothetical protein
LFDADGSRRSIDEKDEIEIAVTDLADSPDFRATAQALADLSQAAEEIGQGRRVERSPNFGRLA